MTDSGNLPVEEKISKAAKSIGPTDQFAEHLWREMQIPREKPSIFTIFPRPLRIAAVSLATVCAMVFAIGPQKVWAAVNQLLGYIPGIGFYADDGSVLALAQAVTVQQDGVTLLVDQVIADQERLVIHYQVTGLKAKMPADQWVCMYDINEVVLPDGTRSHVMGGDSSGIEDGLSSRVEFAPLKDGVKEISLHIGMNGQDPLCKAPTEFNASLKLTAAPANLSTAVVNEFPTPTEPETQAAQGSVQDPSAAIRFTVNRMVTLDDGYVITLKTGWDNQEWQSIWPNFDGMTITDAAGKQVPFEQANEVTGENEIGLRLKKKDIQFPLKLAISSVMISGMPSEPATFTFDTGPAPQADQEWKLDQKMNVFGIEVKIVSAKAITDTANPGNAPGYAFDLEYPTRIGFINFGIDNPQEYGDSFGSTIPNGDHGQTVEMFFSKKLPTGKISLRVNTIQYKQPGDWQVEIDPTR